MLLEGRLDRFGIAALLQKARAVQPAEFEAEGDEIDEMLDAGRLQRSVLDRFAQRVGDEGGVAQPVEKIIGLGIVGRHLGRGQDRAARGANRLPHGGPMLDERRRRDRAQHGSHAEALLLVGPVQQTRRLRLHPPAPRLVRATRASKVGRREFLFKSGLGHPARGQASFAPGSPSAVKGFPRRLLDEGATRAKNLRAGRSVDAVHPPTPRRRRAPLRDLGVFLRSGVAEGEEPRRGARAGEERACGRPAWAG